MGNQLIKSNKQKELNIKIKYPKGINFKLKNNVNIDHRNFCYYIPRGKFIINDSKFSEFNIQFKYNGKKYLVPVMSSRSLFVSRYQSYGEIKEKRIPCDMGIIVLRTNLRFQIIELCFIYRSNFSFKHFFRQLE